MILPGCGGRDDFGDSNSSWISPVGSLMADTPSPKGRKTLSAAELAKDADSPPSKKSRMASGSSCTSRRSNDEGGPFGRSGPAGGALCV